MFVVFLYIVIIFIKHNNDTYKNVSVTINREHMVLFVDGIPAGENNVPTNWLPIFGEGSYHMLELPLYEDYLRENVKDRLYQRGVAQPQ